MDSNAVKNRSFLGAIAAAIKALCMMLIDGIGVAQEGIAMADKAVKVAREKQGIELAISFSDYANLAVTQGAVVQAAAQLESDDWVGTDAKRKLLVDEAKTRLKKAVEEEMHRIAADRLDRQ